MKTKLENKRLKQQVIMGDQNNNNYPKLKKKSYD